MDDFFTIFDALDSHGPGTTGDTLSALQLVPHTPESILEMGCGPGNATLVLAEHTAAQVTALDNHEPSLERLRERAGNDGLASRITTVNASMDELPFPKSSFDLLWCENSVYIMGFEKALSYWRDFLTTEGVLVLSDLVWMDEGPSAPEDMKVFWEQEYSDMKALSKRIEQIRAQGYEVLGTHALGHEGWAAYYEPLALRCAEVRDQLADTSVADAMLEQVEILKKQAEGAFTYVFFVLRQVEGL